MLNEIKHEFEVAGKKGFFSYNKVARKSHAAVLAQLGDTVVLASVGHGNARTDADFFPMSVEYVAMMYAGGKISGSRFVKRDRFPNDNAILKARIIDRSFRPMFPGDFRDELQLIVKVMSFDPEVDPMLLGINAISAALQIAGVPFAHGVAGVRVGLNDSGLFNYISHVDGDDVGVNEDASSKMDLVLAGYDDKLINIDSHAFEVPEDQYVEAMEYGLDLMKEWLEIQDAFVAKVGKAEVKEYTSFGLPENIVADVYEAFSSDIEEDITAVDRKERKGPTVDKMIDHFGDKYANKDLAEAYEKVAKKIARKLVVSTNKRVDGRGLDDIRELDVQTGLLPRVHGTGLFTRGMTQVLTTATLGSTKSQLLIDDMTGDEEKRYMHYYIEAPYSHGEAGRYKYIAGRREVGHGTLAEKALYPVIPTEEEFPYTIILMSEIMSEEGSSSMASTCGSTLALLDAGVPIYKPVAGIAIGIMFNEDDPDNYKLLTDMQGVEDFYGFMDFKVTGTTDGITAIQMDTKAQGLPLQVFKEAIVKAKDARSQILDFMTDVIATPSEKLSQYAPKVEVFKISTSKIGEVIGPGGKHIKAIIEESGAEVNIEDDGTVQVLAASDESIAKAKDMVMERAFVPQIGEKYTGKVRNIMDFGAFVEIVPGVEGLVHVSELSDEYVKDVHDFVKEGQEVTVKVLDVDEGSGKIKLSIKAVKAAAE